MLLVAVAVAVAVTAIVSIDVAVAVAVAFAENQECYASERHVRYVRHVPPPALLTMPKAMY